MVMSTESKEQLGYTRHEGDVDGQCFYCSQPLVKAHYDYVPPRDVAGDPALRALVTEPFIYVSTCHACKTYLYPKRYTLRTPEARKAIIANRRAKVRIGIDEIKRQLTESPLMPWQTHSTDAFGRKTVIDIPDNMLNDDERRKKAAFMSKNNKADAADFDLGF